MPSIEEALSQDRFETYLRWAGDDRERALALYTLNTQLCESLYTPLQMLEIAFRNRIHSVMTEAHGAHWFELSDFQKNLRQAEMIRKAKEELTENKKDHAASRVVAAVSFGFWTALVGSQYEDLWQQTLRKIARKENGKGLQRKDFAQPLGPIRSLRNRIAHHESILGWNLPAHHDKIIELTGWLSPSAAAWSLRNCRFASVYPANGVTLCRAKTQG